MIVDEEIKKIIGGVVAKQFAGIPIPEILVERPKPHSFPELDTLLKRGYNFVGITENVEFYRLSENSSPL